MLFNSVEFLIFFPVVTMAYFMLPHRFRWGLLLLASCVFYMAFIPVYILILAITIVIDYFAGIMIEQSTGKRKNGILLVSILSTCLVLVSFKYLNFFNSSIASIALFFHWNYPIEILKIILPIGLSFHTFQSLSYVIEVYRGHQKAERHFGIYSLYVMFYPQLVAGPIERPQNLLHQFREPHSFDYDRVTSGLKLMAWGLFKKIVIADRLAILVNQVYGDVTHFDGIVLIVATVFFAFQIYCDFSGYSDIALGAAQVMGFKLMLNFRRPYFSKSISEFWKRWHISLSTWFRDYLYISLGGNRVPPWRRHVNLFVTFVVSGFWHGANWTYVIWGALNGFYLVFSIWTEGIRRRIRGFLGLGGGRFPWLLRLWQGAVTFSLICFAWIFFRAKTVGDAWYVVTHLFQRFDRVLAPGYFGTAFERAGMDGSSFAIALGSILLLETVHWVQRKVSVRQVLAIKPLWFRWLVYVAVILLVAIFGVYGKNDFIYFQF